MQWECVVFIAPEKAVFGDFIIDRVEIECGKQSKAA